MLKKKKKKKNIIYNIYIYIYIKHTDEKILSIFALSLSGIIGRYLDLTE